MLRPMKIAVKKLFSFHFLDLSGMNQLPPLDYDQDEQTVTLNINLVDVKVEDISLGFSSRKVSRC